jgi:hypothetical protein
MLLLTIAAITLSGKVQAIRLFLAMVQRRKVGSTEE